jgi:hypothetical protein
MTCAASQVDKLTRLDTQRSNAKAQVIRVSLLGWTGLTPSWGRAGSAFALGRSVDIRTHGCKLLVACPKGFAESRTCNQPP